jgi:hypothetical protein
MGGTRYNARGIDEEGNAANCVESEQIVFKHVYNESYHKIYTYSLTQIRGSMPFFWRQDGVKAKVSISRSLESCTDAFTKHCDTLFTDYDGDPVLMINLLSTQNANEEVLTQGIN